MTSSSSPADAPPHVVKRRRKPWPVWMHLVVAVVLVAIIRAFVVQSFYVPSGSMIPTLSVGDRVVVTKFSDDFHRGDVVVFDGTDAFGGFEGPRFEGTIATIASGIGRLLGIDVNERDYVKRLVGLPGDRVTCCDDQGRLSINGVAVDETFLPDGTAASDDDFDVVVPVGRAFFLGDNRSNSADSRAHLGEPGGGMVAMSDLIGKPALRYWPLGRVGTLPGDAELAAIPRASGS